MENKYIFLIDVDGTLLCEGSNKISDKLCSKIQKLKQQGHIFAISTGRALQNALTIDGANNFSYICALFGSEIYSVDEQKIIVHPKAMPKQNIKKFVKQLEENNVYWSYKNEDIENVVENNVELLKKHPNFSKQNIITREEFEQDYINDRVCQMLIGADDVVKNIICDYNEFSFYYMPGHYYDVTRTDASKSDGVEYFKKNFKDYKIVCIGDSVNNLGMFKVADISIAMGNAIDDVKKQTTYVTKSAKEDGVLFALNNILKL